MATLAGADIRGYYTALGIELPAWSQDQGSVRCFADPESHSHGDRNPSCSISLTTGAWKCHGCGSTAAPMTPRSPKTTRRAQRST